MSSKYDDLLIGKQYGTLKIISVNEEATKNCKGKHRMYNCICSKCNREQIIRGHSFLSGNTTTCNCNRLGKNEFYTFDDTSFIMFDQKGYCTIIDKDDFEKINQYYWFKDANTRRKYWRSSSTKVFLHKYITNTNSIQIVDHKNGNIDDNRKSNLRLATVSQNARNVTKPKRDLPIGVCYDIYGKRYVSYIRDNSGNIIRKYFYDPDNAIKQRIEWENIYYNDGFKPHYSEYIIPIHFTNNIITPIRFV